MTLRIAIVLNSSWNIFNFRRGLMKALAKSGYEIIAIAPKDRYSDRLGFEFHELPMNQRGRNPFQDIRLFFKFLTVLKDSKPDLLLLFTPKPNIYGNVAAKLMGIPTISNVAGLGTVFVGSSPLQSIVQLLYKISLRLSKKVFFQNQEDLDLFSNRGMICRDKSERLPGSGVDTDALRPTFDKKRQDNSFSFLLATRILKEKGIFEYAEAATLIQKKHGDVRFQLAGFLDTGGQGSITKADFHDLIADAGIEYLGVSDNIQDLISDSDCVVLPSYYREGVPRILLEAASLAKPIITTDNVGCKDIVEDGNTGFLCKVRDSADLAEKMEKMLSLPLAVRNEMGARGRRKAELEFDEKIVVRKYQEAIKTILAEIPRGIIQTA